ncbi:MAG TPA: hypothetical protein VGK59_07205 [Ohtaekwangia sp.]
MEKFRIDEPIHVFGFEVKSFPLGIGEAFDSLIDKVPDGLARPYYGISYCTDSGVVYLAAALEKFAGEGKQLGYDVYTIASGSYDAITVPDWRTKTESIKDVFMELMKDNTPDKDSPCIEWYKNDDEMVCLVKERGIKKEVRG